MARFEITQFVERPGDAGTSRITDLLLGAQDSLYSTTRLDGQITRWEIAGGVLTPVEDRSFSSGVIAGNQPTLALVETGDGTALLSGGGADGGWTLRDLRSDGSFGALSQLSGTFLQPLVQPQVVGYGDGSSSVYAGLNGRTGLVQIDLATDGTVAEITYLRDTPEVATGDVTALAQARIDGTDIVIAASTMDSGITAFVVGPDGTLTAGDTLRLDDGLRMATPTALETVTVAGQTYVIAAGATSDSLTVLALEATGGLRITDHVIDDRNTRFEGVTALSTATYAGESFVFAAGADDGISAFQLLDGGRLLHRAQIADTTTASLANISALATRGETGGIGIFAASATEPGLTRLALALSPEDQVIRDTGGSDTLTGGAGADVFVFGADGVADTVSDFTLGEDRVDLGSWTGLRSKTQLFFDETPDGITITYGAESLRLISVDGQSITQSSLLETDLICQTSLPLTLTAGLPGPITAPPALPARYIPPAGSPPPPAPLDRSEDFGSRAPDTLVGGAGNDIFFGQGGDDNLRGMGGDDLLFGGPGNDLLAGDAGDDQLYGGEGRDLGWMRPNRPVDSRNGDTLFGGAGDDVLYGQAGRDTLDGGTGNDLLVGGAGRDTFVFRAGKDVIADFHAMTDRVMLDDSLWSGTLTAAAVVSRYGTQDGSDLVLRFADGHSLRLEDVTATDALVDQITFL